MILIQKSSSFNKARSQGDPMSYVLAMTSKNPE